MPPLVPARSIEFFVLHDMKPAGPSMGRYADSEIPESIIDMFGRRYVYVGVAPRTWGGQFDVDALQPGEFILPPGLVYRLEHMKPSWLSQLFRLH